MHEALFRALGDAEADKHCRAILLTGAGRGFCAGQDLSDRMTLLGSSVPDLGVTLEKYYNPLMRRIQNLSIPVVCAVNGIAAGAGANIAFGCDIVLAARSAKFLQAFVRIGLAPDSGGSWLLPRLVGRARARALSLLGEPISAEDAERWGLIFKTVDDGKLKGEASAICARLAVLSPNALAAIKKALDHSETASFGAQLDYERDAQRELGAGPDYAEGVKAFMEKRPANFGARKS
jgi:2-(1,2-epoxy-1,2-dihydrophenyl)acetyl-CoA isomerase